MFSQQSYYGAMDTPATGHHRVPSLDPIVFTDVELDINAGTVDPAEPEEQLQEPPMVIYIFKIHLLI